MGIDKGWMAGSTAMLLLRLLEERDRYGYQMIEELRRRSDHTFDLKAGTLLPFASRAGGEGVDHLPIRGEGAEPESIIT